MIQAHPFLVANPSVAESLRDLERSDNPRQKEMATALLKTHGRSSAGGLMADRLDPAFFEAKVLPVFNALGDDGQNCVGCHRSHTILKLLPPGKDGHWSADDVRANFRATLRVVNLAQPHESLLLRKPTWEAAEEAEAQNDPSKKAHAGGVRFEPGTSPEYQAILDWINGARLKPADTPSNALMRNHPGLGLDRFTLGLRTLPGVFDSLLRPERPHPRSRSGDSHSRGTPRCEPGRCGECTTQS